MAFFVSCKEAVRLHSESLDHELPCLQRLSLWLHVLLCRACARYGRQIGFVRHAVRRMVEREEEGLEPNPLTLSPEAVERMKQALRAARR